MKPLPERMLRLMSVQDRASIGQKTKAEVLEQGEVKSERQLQGMIVNLLRLRGIEPLWHRCDKKGRATVGWPDITFAVQTGRYTYNNEPRFTQSIPCCWEVKLNGKLSEDQRKMMETLVLGGWRWRLIRSVDEARLELKNMGVE